MKEYVKAVLHQLEVANDSILKIIDTINEVEIDEEILEKKRTVRQILSHIALIYKADFFIMSGASKVEMDRFYESSTPHSLLEIKEALVENFQFLYTNISRFSEEDFLTPMTSWWGVTYTKYEWLIEIVGHVYHHRGQLHTILIAKGHEIKVPLFE
ncbi:DinB family protein [Cytobacillus sp. FJAT-54145]|uniref:DinB family protein n=1 Tax=Cytobacillus spartinae TaxID=3299023 RepID=A0ABW6K4W7_9BACI